LPAGELSPPQGNRGDSVRWDGRLAQGTIIAVGDDCAELAMRLPQAFRPFLLLAALAAICSLDIPAVTAAPCSDLDMVVALFQSHGAAVFMIPPDRLPLVARDAQAITGGHYDGVTRGFLVRGKGGFVLGFEIGGCLVDPIKLEIPKVEASA
jgi:hypothetical protein